MYALLWVLVFSVDDILYCVRRAAYIYECTSGRWALAIIWSLKNECGRQFKCIFFYQTLLKNGCWPVFPLKTIIGNSLDQNDGSQFI